MTHLRRFTLLTGASALLLVSVTSFAVGTRRFELQTADDFKGGDLTGVAVASDGTVQAGYDLGSTPVSDATTIWASLARADGSVLLGTGNEGKLVEVKGGKSTVLGTVAGALAVTSLTEAWGGAVVAGTLPEGKLMKWDKGKLSELVALKDTDHIWALAFDKKTNSVFAATGPKGQLWRVEANGTAQVYFDAEEDHLVSVAVGTDGQVYAGASDKARLYKVSGPGRASVLYDFNRTEVRGIALTPKGEVYAISNDLGGASFTSGYSRGMSVAASPVPSGGGTRGRGILMKFEADGTPDTLIDDSSEHFVSLVIGDDGRPLIGTGAEGRVYAVDDSHGSLLLADVAERQVTGLLVAGKQRFVVGSDPAVLHPIRGMGGNDAVWTGKVLDAGIRARFGRLAWDAAGTIELSTRSGNTALPDESWSPWSKGMTAPSAVESPAGRYLQIRARFNKDDKAVLTRVELPFVTDNLRATITGIDATSPAQRAASGVASGVQASGGAVSKSTDTRVNLTWRVDNPDQDELRYRVQYRMVGTTAWFDLLKPGEKLSSPSYSWDVANLPEGRYRVRVSVSDEPSNPPDRVKRHERESGVVLVDTTAPTIDSLKANGKKVSGTALDGIGPIQRIEISVAGTDEWTPYYPNDGVYDEPREEFDADVSQLAKGPALLTLRVFDQAGNVTVASVSVK